jgi:hypothetical protein
MFKNVRLTVIAAIAATLVALPASAATLDITKQGSNAFKDKNGMNAWYESTTYSLGGKKVSASAGLFRLNAKDAKGVVKSFVAFCLEPLEILRLPKTYAIGTPLSQTVVGRLGALVSNALHLVKDSRSAAAFQLAAWEIANEGAKTKLSLSGGAFKVLTANKKTVTLAQNWLDGIGSGKWAPNPRVTIISAQDTQDLVTDLAPVPVPAAGLMMMGALGGLAALRRRRRA